MPTRDEFSERIKRTVAQRAGYLCSNPECRGLTIGPHSQPEESLSTGVAAHICAAAPGGPRFDSTQTQSNRKSILNAIWLCHTCSDRVDKDIEKYSKEVLIQWKVQHEQYISEGGGLPKIPEITLQTQRSLTLPDLPGATITGNDIKTYREHVLSIYNPNNRAMSNYKCRIQFPEPIVYHLISDSPAGVNIQCNPDKMNLIVHASGSGSVTRLGSRGALEYIVGADTIPPKSRLELHFLSVVSPTSSGIIPEFNEDALEYHILGEFHYLLHGEYLPRYFLVLLEFDFENRRISSLPCEEDDRTRKIRIRKTAM